MKTFNRFALTVIAVLLALSLCACSADKKAEDSTKAVKTTKNVKEAKLDDILALPEKSVELEQFIIGFTYPDPEQESGSGYMTLMLDDSVTPGVVYVADTISRTNETIYEMTPDQVATKYVKNYDTGKYELYSDDNEAVQQEAAYIQELFASFGYAYSMEDESVRYKKCATEEMPFTGDAYVYDIIVDGVQTGRIWVDQKTGIVVKCIDAEGEAAFEVQQLETEIDMPKYK